MLDELGNGTICPCAWCGTLLAARRGYLTIGGRRLIVDRLEQDRIIPGGPYARWNVVPACRRCNHERAVDEQTFNDGCDYGGARRQWTAAA